MEGAADEKRIISSQMNRTVGWVDRKKLSCSGRIIYIQITV